MKGRENRLKHRDTGGELFTNACDRLNVTVHRSSLSRST